MSEDQKKPRTVNQIRKDAYQAANIPEPWNTNREYLERVMKKMFEETVKEVIMFMDPGGYCEIDEPRAAEGLRNAFDRHLRGEEPGLCNWTSIKNDKKNV